MLELQHQGKCRSIGVSNFGPHHFEGLKKAGLPMPVVNQIEFHPFFQQHETVKYCQKRRVALMAYTPLAEGKELENPTLKKVAAVHGKSTAQVMLRWGVQRGLV